MEFKQLEAFVAVVDYGSFSEAARKLYLTQPTISAHVRSLEEELHTQTYPAHHQKNDDHYKRLPALRQCCPHAGDS